MTLENREIEVRFLEIDARSLKERLIELGAEDLGEDLFEEIIFYDKDLKWRDSKDKRVRLRKTDKAILLSYKQRHSLEIDGTEEIEFAVSDMHQAELFLERINLTPYRHQQKKRHSFILGQVTVDIDTWPKIPTYVELEGPSEDSLRHAAAELNLDWKDALLEAPLSIMESRYHIPVASMRWFTFDRCE